MMADLQRGANYVYGSASSGFGLVFSQLMGPDITATSPVHWFLVCSIGAAFSSLDLVFSAIICCFCNIQFEEARDADDTIRGHDGYDFEGHRLLVELAHGGHRSSAIDRYSCYTKGGGGGCGGVSRRSEYRDCISANCEAPLFFRSSSHQSTLACMPRVEVKDMRR
ncbi:hypothetical protein Vadar_022093 [Vaccinium darrowii]|uniref:Uncharacterized protein n=1 Tax=Vaccinium darrowii TaxID=229202 RepID=A0ACB7YGG9_9ERIC|nr:hypothetical protein Vadar_022093 [Vaccinium darrowii]